MKLIYLADVYHMEKYGKRLTDVPFRHWHYGPYSETIDQEIELLCGEGIIKQETYQTRTGHYAEIPKPNVERTTVNMPDEALDTMKEIVEDYGEMNTEQIVKIAKSGPPFAGTPFGKEIDFQRIDVVTELSKKLGISTEEAATTLAENNKELMESLDRARERVKA
jgi:uncharacterized phage-associated protein